MNTVGKFAAIFDKEDNVCDFHLSDFFFSFLYTYLLLKITKSIDGKFFPLRGDPFSEGSKIQFESLSFALKPGYSPLFLISSR